MKIPVKYPAGTTKEQWDRYEFELRAHNEFIANYKNYLERIVKHLEFVRPGHNWTTEEILKTMTNEIKMSDSMSAPNKPGYYRANND